MKFTYDAYGELIETVINNGYTIAGYENYKDIERPAILRHDIDTDISKALDMAEFEHEMKFGDIRSTYFVLLTSDFYNVASKQNIEKMKKIISLGHTIGLHFDEMAYPDESGDAEAIKKRIINEARILSEILEYDIKTVSYHRPSKAILDAELEIPGLINSYGHVFFHDFKYLSDSRRRWREPAQDIIASRKHDKLHILTHAFWYNESEKDIENSVSSFINMGNVSRWRTMHENITDLDSIMPFGEVK